MVYITWIDDQSIYFPKMTTISTATNDLESKTEPTFIFTDEFDRNNPSMMDALNRATIIIIESNSWIESDQLIFQRHNNLTQLIIMNGVQNIPEYAFESSGLLKKVKFPETKIKCGNYAFAGCGFTTLNLSANIELGQNVFDCCQELTTVIFENGVKSIPKYTFMNCQSLQYITIPRSMITIGLYAFAGCDLITTIYTGYDVIYFPFRNQFRNIFPKAEIIPIHLIKRYISDQVNQPGPDNIILQYLLYGNLNKQNIDQIFEFID